MPEHRNALAQATSPYLLQHAHNPVHWQPWGPEALEQARLEDRPILLSIGYSACHWCHVMAHESFEDEETAGVMNELFVNIKVDREERPDLDRIYQSAHQLLAQRPGGWPLTLFLTPDDLTPFFGGTYFPREARFGLPSFKDLLQRVAELYRTRAGDIRRQNESLVQALQSIQDESGGGGARLEPVPLDMARRQLGQSFDATHGGFGEAPKFPHPTNVERLLRHYAATAAAGTADEQALHMARFTLEKMARGGIYDQLGGGFCRYSVDDRWEIPHFEKMLYDNGPLLALYAEAWQISGSELLRRVAGQSADWALREMQSPEGGYYCSLDADSEGEEGRFYVWEREQVQRLLEPQEYAVAAAYFGLQAGPNFEGRWHLRVAQDLADVARRLGLDEAAAARHLESARRKLLAAREQRVRPGLDDKVLTSWNALMIKGMAVAGRILDEPQWIDSAGRALDFLRSAHWREGRLLATSRAGHAHLAAYLDDYAFLLDAILALLQARWRDGDLSFALELAEVLLEAFQDPGDGGFYFTAHEHEQLIGRPKPMADESLPSGNGIAAHALGRLGHLLGETRYLQAAERTLAAAWPSLSRLPYAHGALLLALEEHLYPPRIAVIRAAGEELERWRAAAGAAYAPRSLSLAIPDEATDLPGLLAERRPRSGPLAYVCEGLQCGAPLTELEDLKAALGAGAPAAQRPAE